ncbi:hypothetical protein AB836_02010 [Rickettsiales bacterium (ex Bugula neritina AB1)]|nr:hypothetical protein AB836_02010 [Rickettsiales bacterium (ex Bugula neritina AB1)]
MNYYLFLCYFFCSNAFQNNNKTTITSQVLSCITDFSINIFMFIIFFDEIFNKIDNKNKEIKNKNKEIEIQSNDNKKIFYNYLLLIILSSTVFIYRDDICNNLKSFGITIQEQIIKNTNLSESLEPLQPFYEVLLQYMQNFYDILSESLEPLQPSYEVLLQYMQNFYDILSKSLEPLQPSYKVLLQYMQNFYDILSKSPLQPFHKELLLCVYFLCLHNSLFFINKLLMTLIFLIFPLQLNFLFLLFFRLFLIPLLTFIIKLLMKLLMNLIKSLISLMTKIYNITTNNLFLIIKNTKEIITNKFIRTYKTTTNILQRIFKTINTEYIDIFFYSYFYSYFYFSVNSFFNSFFDSDDYKEDYELI